MTRSIGVRLQLLPQLHHVRIHRPRVRERTHSPTPNSESCRASADGRDSAESSTAGCTRRASASVPRPCGCTMRRSKSTSVSEKWITLRASRRGAPQHRADPRHQFARAERLHHVIVGADLEQQHLVHFIAHRAQHDDRRLHAARRAAACRSRCRSCRAAADPPAPGRASRVTALSKPARPSPASTARKPSCSSITPMVSRRLSSSSITRIVCIGNYDCSESVTLTRADTRGRQRQPG